MTGRDRPPPRERDEDGVVAIVVAVSMAMLLVVAAMVLDFGLARFDRQRVKSATDSAVMAGLRAADGKTGEVYTYRGVCGALAYLRVNDPRLAGLPAGICATPDDTLTCDESNPAANGANYHETTTFGQYSFDVTIKSPYDLSTDGFSDETSYSALTADGSSASGCDQVGVVVRQSRPPGLGSLATSGDLSFGVRSVGRVRIGGIDELSPALIVLERTACSALTIGAGGGGVDTYVRVKGFGATPGSIHLDSEATGADCGSGSNQQLAQGKATDGIVAYGSPTPAGLSGLITSYATQLGRADNVVFDDLNKVYGTPSTSGTGIVKSKVAGRNRVGRRAVDIRYRVPARTAITEAANATANWGLTSANSAAAGWTRVTCSPSSAALAAATKLFIDCANPTIGPAVTNASEVYFGGYVNKGNLSMPNATRVYINNGSSNADAMKLGTNDGFCVRSACTNPTASTCSTTSTTNRARVFVRSGHISMTGGLLRMCNTTTFLLGGDKATGCLPATNTTDPTGMPCPGSTAGTSLIDSTGGSIDWSAPNQYPGAVPATDRVMANANFEDLALWAESAGQYRLTGGGGLFVVGVFFTPNSDPFQIGGGGGQILSNAQFVAQRISIKGGGQLTMTTDPRNAVSIPTLSGFVLVR